MTISTIPYRRCSKWKDCNLHNVAIHAFHVGMLSIVILTISGEITSESISGYTCEQNDVRTLSYWSRCWKHSHICFHKWCQNGVILQYQLGISESNLKSIPGRIAGKCFQKWSRSVQDGVEVVISAYHSERVSYPWRRGWLFPLFGVPIIHTLFQLCFATVLNVFYQGGR